MEANKVVVAYRLQQLQYIASSKARAAVTANCTYSWPYSDAQQKNHQGLVLSESEDPGSEDQRDHLEGRRPDHEGLSSCRQNCWSSRDSGLPSAVNRRKRCWNCQKDRVEDPEARGIAISVARVLSGNWLEEESPQGLDAQREQSSGNVSGHSMWPLQALAVAGTDTGSGFRAQGSGRGSYLQ